MIKQIILIFLAYLTLPLPAQNTYYRIYDDAYTEFFRKVVEVKGGYMAMGASSKYSMSDLTVYRLDSLGYILHQTNYYPGVLNVGYDMVKCADNGALVAGYSLNSDGHKKAYLVRVDSMGATKWEKLYEYNYLEEIHKVISLDGNQYMLMGYGVDSVNPNFFFYYDFLRRIDDFGNILTEKRYSRNEWNIPNFSAITQTIDGGFMIAARNLGASPDSVYDDRILLIKTNLQGDTIWTKKIPKPHMFRQFREAAISNIISLPDGSFIGQGGYVFKADSEGEIVWQDTSIYKAQMSYIGNNEFVLYNHVIPPITSLQVLKMNGDHTLLWANDYPMLSNGYVNYSPLHLIATTDGGFTAVGGYRTDSSMQGDVSIIHTDCELNIDNPIFCNALGVPHSISQDNIKIYPNPAQDYLTISADKLLQKVAIYNTNGKLLLLDEPKGKYESRYSFSNLSQGLYFLKINLIDGQEMTEKIIIE